MPFKLTEEMKRWAKEKAKEKLRRKNAEKSTSTSTTKSSQTTSSSSSDKLAENQIKVIDLKDCNKDLDDILDFPIANMDKNDKKYLWNEDGSGKILTFGRNFQIENEEFHTDYNTYPYLLPVIVYVLVDDFQMMEFPSSAFTAESQDIMKELKPYNSDDDQFFLLPDDYTDDDEEENQPISSTTKTESTTNLASGQIQVLNYRDFTDKILPMMTKIESREGATLLSSINSLKGLRKIFHKFGKVLNLGEQFDVRTRYFWENGEQNQLCVNILISDDTVIEFPFSAFTPESQGKWDTLRAGAKLNFNYPGNDDDDRPPIPEQDLGMEESELED